MVDLKLQMAKLRLLSVLQPSQRASLQIKLNKGSVFLIWMCIFLICLWFALVFAFTFAFALSFSSLSLDYSTSLGPVSNVTLFGILITCS